MAGLAFLLPGATLSCSRNTSFSGAQLATHAVPRIPNQTITFTTPNWALPFTVPGPRKQTWTGDCDVPAAWLNTWGQALAIVALAAAAIGFLLAALRLRAGPGWCAAAGLLALAIAAWHFLAGFNPFSGPDYTVNPDVGYWVALLAFATAGVWQILRVWKAGAA